MLNTVHIPLSSKIQWILLPGQLAGSGAVGWCVCFFCFFFLNATGKLIYKSEILEEDIVSNNIPQIFHKLI